MIIPLESGTDDVANNSSNHLISSLSVEPVLIILLDVVIGLIKDILVLDFIFNPNNAAEGFLDFLLTSCSALPAIKADDLYDAVNIGHDTLYDNRSAAALQTVKKFSKSSNASINFFFRYNFFFGLSSFLSKFEKELQEFNTCQKSLFVLFTECFQLSPSLMNFGSLVCFMILATRLNFDLLRGHFSNPSAFPRTHQSGQHP